jgi:tetraacyldisaccharide 4'-kinase
MGIVELLYYLGLSVKKYYAFRNRRKLPFRVISIGNITVGGTGKTPVTIAVAQEAKRRGFNPSILTRGYKGKRKGPCFVTKGEGALLGVDDAGDEPVLMAQKLRGVPIVKGPDRYESGVFSVEELGGWAAEGRSHNEKVSHHTANSGLHAPRSLLFILDDGFQHWRLFRDKDVVLIDADNPFGNSLLLPLGILREPVESLSRADIIVLTKCFNDAKDDKTDVSEITNKIRQYNPGAPIFLSGYSHLVRLLVSGQEKPLSWIEGKKVFGFCALGNPESFKKTLKEAGAELLGFKKYKDHFMYGQREMRDIGYEAARRGAEWIATTEKDIIKTRDLDLPENIFIIEIELSVEMKFYDDIFSFPEVK